MLTSWKLSKMVRVSDDWHPCFTEDGLIPDPERKIEEEIKNGTVSVTLMNMIYTYKKKFYKKYNTKSFVRLCVWGADDDGMEMDFEGTEKENEAKFFEWKEKIWDKLDSIYSHEYFELIGMKRA